jgi:hypothetical protein
MDMPDFDPGLKLAYQGLVNVPDAAVKHMIVISDGDPAPPSQATLQQFVNQKITISTVAVGAHGPAESTVMKNVAKATNGKYWEARDPNALPRIFQREARRVTQPLIYEKPKIQTMVARDSEMIAGINAFRPIRGYVLTTRKENALVEIPLIASEPGGEENRTLLAGWTYGLGKTVALTTDAAPRWSIDWMGWPDYSKLVSQVVRWSLRPSTDEGKFSVATDYQDGRVRVVITALDKDDEFLNGLDMQAGVVGPGMKGSDLRVEQVAPGRYVGTYDAQDAGSYMIMITPGPGKAPLRTGINVPYSDEFRNLEPNEPLLAQLGQLLPEGGQPGQTIESPDGFQRMGPMLEVNSFRHDLPKATSSQDIWPLLLLVGSCIFFGDVFVRRVQVSFAWVPRLAARLLGRKMEAPVEETIQRLRSRKAEVEDRIAQLRASTRFEVPAGAPIDADAIEETSVSQPPPSPSSTPAPTLAAGDDQESYTARLLKAKEKAWEKK